MRDKQGILKKIKSKIEIIDPNARVILFGSRAREDNNEDSDWDFLILTDLNITRELKNRFSDAMFDAELETGEVLTGIVQDFNSWDNYSNTPIFRNILAEGVEI